MKSKITGPVILLLIFLISTSAFAAQFNFTPRVTARETYTDNVFLTKNDKQDDFITDVSAGGTLSILGKTAGMDFSFDPAYVWYEDNSRDSTWRLPATLGLWSDFSRQTRFEFFNRFLRSEDPDENRPVVSDEGDEILAPGDSTLRRGRGWYVSNFANARVDHQLGADDSVFGQFLYSLRREEESGGNENDRYAPSAGLTYWFGPKWGTTVDAVYTRALFENSGDFHDIAGRFQLQRRLSRRFQLFGRYGYAYRDNDDDEANDYQVHAPSFGFSYDLEKHTRISLGLGYFYQNVDGGDNEQAPFLNGDIFKRWDYGRWNASLLGQTGLDRNDFGNERLGFEYYAGVIANARYDFTRKIFGNVSGTYRYADYINESRVDSRYRIGGGLGWLATKWMSLNLDYIFNGLSSDRRDNYQENRVWFRITLQPDKPWRF